MSNILIIKHGSLGDIVQISGVLRDIKEHNKDKNIFFLTTSPYLKLMEQCPFVDSILLDKRLPRWNILYLFNLKKKLSSFNFTQVYDLQNSSRTSFYRRYLLPNTKWNSTETILDIDEKKKDFDKDSVLDRFKIQLEKINVKAKYTLNPDFKWAIFNIDKIIENKINKKFLLLFPFCSPQLSHKKWTYYNDLIKIIKFNHPNLEVVIAPGPNEIGSAKEINAVTIMNNEKVLNIMELAGLISKASYVVANDTGPAHMAAHLGSNGIVLFGHHTTPEKVSIETNNFKALKSKDLKNLKAEDVYDKIKDELY